MIKETALEFFERDLLKLKEEINLYENENDLWKVVDGINNSAGNLCLHMVGSLNHFIGAMLGNTGYVRNRDNEFAEKNVERNVLVQQIDSTIEMIKSTLNSMDEKDFEKEFPIEFIGKKRTTMFLVMQMVVHINYHWGQINYHRRLIAK